MRAERIARSEDVVSYVVRKGFEDIAEENFWYFAALVLSFWLCPLVLSETLWRVSVSWLLPKPRFAQTRLCGLPIQAEALNSHTPLQLSQAPTLVLVFVLAIGRTSVCENVTLVRGMGVQVRRQPLFSSQSVVRLR